MRQLIIILIILSCEQSICQSSYPSSSNQESLVKLTPGKSIPSDVKKLFGEPAELTITQDYEIMNYNKDNSSFSLRFNNAKVLSDFIYNEHNKPTESLLIYENIKKARTATSKEEINKLLGKASDIMISANEESWHYNLGDRTISIRFKRSDKFEISQFTYVEFNKNSQAILPEQTTYLIQDKTTPEDVIKYLGVPSVKRIDKDSESWTYESKKTSLFIHFNIVSKLSNFLYTENSK